MQVAGANSSMALDADQDHVTIFYETCMLCREQQQTCEVKAGSLLLLLLDT